MTPVLCSSTSLLFAVFAGAATMGCVAAFVLFSWLGTQRKYLALGVAGIVLFAGLTAFLVYDNEVSVATEQAWTFTFSVSLRGPTYGASWVVIPRTVDASLVSSLTVTTGLANWSFVDTPHGPAIYVQYTGNANLTEYTILYQPVGQPPDANLTMTTLNNSYGFGTTWLASSGTPGMHLDLYAWVSWQGGWNVYTDLPAGWAQVPSRLIRQLPGAVVC